MTIPKNIIFLIFISAICSCSDKKKKEMLSESFCSFHARNVPISIFNLGKLNEFDILSQDKKTVDERYNYPNTFVVGMYNNKNKTYDRIHIIEGFSPIENYNLLKKASDYYETDTTYLDNIQLTDTIYINNKDSYLLKDTMHIFSLNEMQSSYKMNEKKYIALIYRKTNPLKDSTIGDFEMWKREIIRLQNDTLKSESLNKMNEHLF